MIGYVLDLAKKHTDEIGFIPRPRLEQYYQRGQVWTQTENDHPCGFLVFGCGWPTLRIYQACIQYDAQRREHGTKLVMQLIDKAHREGYDAISLWCADDLEANEFWRSLGFQLITRKSGGQRRGRLLNRWAYFLPEPIQSRLWE